MVKMEHNSFVIIGITFGWPISDQVCVGVGGGGSGM